MKMVLEIVNDRKKVLTVLCAVIILSISACTTVQPYQRGTLSKEEMQFDSDASGIAAREHFLNSLEGSTGGFGTGGGGCGCN